MIEILEKIDEVEDIELLEGCKVYAGVSYDSVYKVKANICNEKINITIGIPCNWQLEIVDIYVDDYNKIVYMPHIQPKGKMCLFDLEGKLIDCNLEGIVTQCIKRAIEIIELGIKEVNKEDFIEEFESYWIIFSDARILKSFVTDGDSIKVISYTDDRTDRKTDGKYIDKKRKEKLIKYIASDSSKHLYLYDNINNIRNGIYVPIVLEEPLYPPDWRKTLSSRYINGLLNNKTINRKELKKALTKCAKDLLAIVKISQPNGISVRIGILIENYREKFDMENMSFVDNTKTIPLSVVRCDKDFLSNRGGAANNTKDKKVLVIGCGSIGGYLISELTKLGISNIGVVDKDILEEENIYRHLLGMEYVGVKKSVAVSKYLSKNIPDINIIPFEDNIEEVLEDYDDLFDEYDIVISAVGNHNVNRWINDYVLNNNLKIPVIYLWNEALGVGNHIAYIETKNTGCYECLFREQINNELYDRTSYFEKGQEFIEEIRGCGSSFVPYGSSNSLNVVVKCIEIVSSYFEGNIVENFIVSLKGNDKYAISQGLKMSDRYKKQENTIEVIYSQQFKRKGCSVCGRK